MSENNKASNNRHPMMGRGPAAMRSIEKPKDMRHTTSRLLPYLRPYRGRIVLALFLLFLNSSTGIIIMYNFRPIINDYIIPADMSGLAMALIWLGAFALIGSLAAYIQSRIMIKISLSTCKELRQKLFVAMQALPISYFAKHKHGQLMSHYTNDIDNIQLALSQSLLQVLSSAFVLIGSISLMIYINWLLFLIMVLVLTIMVLLSKFLTKYSRKYFKDQQKDIGALNGYIEELIDGLREVKIYNYEQQAEANFERFNYNYQQSATKASIFAGIVMPIMGNLNNLAYTLTAVTGGLLTVAGSLDIGSLAAYLLLSRGLSQPLQQVTSQLNNVFAALAGAERVFEQMEQEPEIDLGDITLKQGADQQSWLWQDGEKLIPVKGDMRLNNIHFAYEQGKPILEDLSFYAKPGQKIAIVGSTGAGKTTIANLLNRFYDIDQGSITYDGLDIRQIKKADLRRSIAFVLQDTHLFSTTVMENIRYSRLEASDDDCISAAKAVNADSFISRLPKGYQTVLTDAGANLSQGQRQLLALARAFCADTPIILLDEATSSIDTRTERLIEQGMAKLMEGRTVFIIAHRLSTVRNAQAIIIIENGQILERGNHQQLLAQGGRYSELYANQALDNL